MRPHLKLSGTSYRLDETYVKVGAEWKYLYRAVDSTGQTIEFMLSARRDVSAAKRFFKKLMRADHRGLPFTIGTDKHASYPEAFAASVKEKVLPSDCKLRRVKYLNNIIGRDHRFIPGHRPPGRIHVALESWTVNNNTVSVTGALGLRDWPGTWDDAYEGTVNFVVVQTSPRRQIRNRTVN